MKKLLLQLIALSLLVLFTQNGWAQLKSDTHKPDISGALTAPVNGIVAGFLDPSKMQMRHSVSMSYGGFSGNGMMLSTYTNLMDYQISEKLMLRTKLGIMTSPYNTYGENFYLNKPRFFGGAMLKYDFNENSSLMFKIESTPYHYYRPTFGDYYHDYDRFE